MARNELGKLAPRVTEAGSIPVSSAKIMKPEKKKKKTEVTDREREVLRWLAATMTGRASISCVSSHICPEETQTVYLVSKRTKCFKKEKYYYTCSPTAKRIIKSLFKKKLANIQNRFLICPTALGKRYV